MMDMPYASKFGQTKRHDLLVAVSKVLVDKRYQVLEMQEVIEQTGLLYEDFRKEFQDLDEVLLAIVQGVSRWIDEPLLSDAKKVMSYDDLTDGLKEFSRRYAHANATILPGVFRVFLTESSRRSTLQKRFFEAGPAAISQSLVAFLDRAKLAKAINGPDSSLVAEALMGMLREPLYHDFAIHSEQLSPTLSSVERAPDVVRMFAQGAEGREP